MATAGSTMEDSIIRIYDLTACKGEVKKAHHDVKHSICCNSPITSIVWRKTIGKHHSELVTSHGTPDYEMKLW